MLLFDCRCMGWGGAYSDEPLGELLASIVNETTVTHLDRWVTVIYRDTTVTHCGILWFYGILSWPIGFNTVTECYLKTTVTHFGLIITDGGWMFSQIYTQQKWYANCRHRSTPNRHMNLLHRLFSPRCHWPSWITILVLEPMLMLRCSFIIHEVIRNYSERRNVRVFAGANPQMLNSRFKNRIAYGGLGTIDLFKRSWRDLSDFMTLEVSWILNGKKNEWMYICSVTDKNWQQKLKSSNFIAYCFIISATTQAERHRGAAIRRTIWRDHRAAMVSSRCSDLQRRRW